MDTTIKKLPVKKLRQQWNSKETEMTSNDRYPDNHNGLRIKTLKPVKLIQNCAIVIKENTKSCEKD